MVYVPIFYGHHVPTIDIIPVFIDHDLLTALCHATTSLVILRACMSATGKWSFSDCLQVAAWCRYLLRTILPIMETSSILLIFQSSGEINNNNNVDVEVNKRHSRWGTIGISTTMVAAAVPKALVWHTLCWNTTKTTMYGFWYQKSVFVAVAVVLFWVSGPIFQNKLHVCFG